MTMEPVPAIELVSWNQFQLWISLDQFQQLNCIHGSSSSYRTGSMESIPAIDDHGTSSSYRTGSMVPVPSKEQGFMEPVPAIDDLGSSSSY
jgi:hypothetical protein